MAILQAQALPNPERGLSEHCLHIRCWLVHSSLQTLLLEPRLSLDGVQPFPVQPI